MRKHTYEAPWTMYKRENSSLHMNLASKRVQLNKSSSVNVRTCRVEMKGTSGWKASPKDLKGHWSPIS